MVADMLEFEVDIDRNVFSTHENPIAASTKTPGYLACEYAERLLNILFILGKRVMDAKGAKNPSDFDKITTRCLVYKEEIPFVIAAFEFLNDMLFKSAQ